MESQAGDGFSVGAPSLADSPPLQAVTVGSTPRSAKTGKGPAPVTVRQRMHTDADGKPMGV